MEARPGILTVKEAAQFLRVSESKVLDGLRRGLIPGQKIVGQWRLAKSELYRGFRDCNRDATPQSTWPQTSGDVPR